MKAAQWMRCSECKYIAKEFNVPKICMNCGVKGTMDYKKDTDDPLIEQLSKLEHQQWQDWTQTLLHRMNEAMLEKKTLEEFALSMGERWSKNWIEYENLKDEVKEFDRVYARDVLKVLEANGIQK